MASILAQRNAVASTFNAVNITGSTITLTSTMVSLGQSTNKIYTTLAQGNFSTATNWISTLNTMSTGKVVAMSANAQTQLVVTQLSTVSSLYYTSTLQNWSTLSGATGLPLATQTIYSAGAVSGDGRVVALTAYGGYLYTSNNAGASFTNTNPNTPYAYFPLNGNTTDAQGNITSGNITVTGSPGYVTGIVGTNAINFANTAGGTPTQYLRGNISNYTNFSISGWFNLQTLPGSGVGSTIFGMGTTGGNYFGIRYIGGTGFVVSYYNSSNTLITIASAPVASNIWYNFTVIFQSGSTSYVYLNNALIGTATTTALLNATTTFALATHTHYPEVAFNGYIDDLKIYNTAITFNPMVPANWSSVAVSNSGQYMLATVAGGGLFTSANFGSTWTQITSTALVAYWSSCFVSASGQYMVTGGGTLTSPQQTGLTGNTSSSTPVTTTWTVNGVTWTCSTSNVNSAAYQPWIAFNNVTPASGIGNYSWTTSAMYNTSTGVYNNTNSTAILGSFTPTPYYGEWLQIQSSVPIVMYNYTFSCGAYGNLPKTYLIVGSNDGTNWYPIHLCSMGSNAAGTTSFSVFSTYIVANYTGTQTVIGAATATATTTSYSTSTTPYTYFRLIANTTFGGQYGNVELCEWYINFLGGQSYSTNYGQSFTNALSIPAQVLAMSGNGQYAIGSNASTYYIQTIAGFTSSGYTSGTVTGSIVAAAASTTGQQMVLVTNNTGNNVYYSNNYGTTFTCITIGTIAMTSCSMSYDGSYITVTNGTTIYQLNNNSSGFSLAVGNNAGQQNQGQNAIALGNQAGYQNQSGNSIILNASGSALNSYYPGLYAAPVATYSALTSQSTTLLGYGTDNQIVQSGITLGTGTPMIYGEWIQLQLTTPTQISSYVLQPRSTFPGRYPVAWTVVGSVDGVNWVVIDTQSGGTSTLWGTYNLKAPSAIYSYFRIIFTQVNSTVTNGTNIIDISGFILYNNGLSIFGTYANYTTTGTQYNILNYNSVPVCIVTYSWNPSVTNSLGIVGDATANYSAYQIAYIVTTNAYTNINYFLGFTMSVSLLGVGEYNTSYIAYQGTATPIIAPLLQVNDMYGATKFQSTVQYPLDVNGVMRTQQLQFQDGTIQSTASNIQYNWGQMGVSWTRTTCPAGNWYYCALNYSGQYQMAVANSGQLYISANYGSTWTSITTAYGLSSNSIGWQWCAMSSTGQYMVAVYQSVGTIGGIYLSYNYGQTWNYVQVSNYYVGLCAMSASGQYMVGAPAYTGSTTSGYIYISSNYGQTWTQTTQYFSGNGAGGVAVSGNGQYMAYVYSNVAYLSSTYGQTWSTLSLASAGVIAMSYTGQYIAISYLNNGAYISSNYGVSFSTNTTPSASYSVSMSSSGQYIILNVYNNGTIYTSNNYGSTFSTATTTNFSSMYGSAISGSGQYQIAVCTTSGYVYTSVTPMIIPSFTPLSGNVNVLGNINLTGSILYNGTAITTGTGSIWTAGTGGVAYYNGGNVGIGIATPLSNAYTGSSAYQGVDIQGSTAYDGQTTLRILNPASQYGRCQLHIIGRNENSNDAWNLTAGRNNLIFGYQTSLNSAITYVNAIQSLFGALGIFSSGYSTYTPALIIGANGNIVANGNVGIGNGSPGYALDVGGTPGLNSSLQVRNGVGSTTTGTSAYPQFILSYNGASTSYAHWIATRHNYSAGAGNAIDFYIWTSGQSSTVLGSTLMMSVTSLGVGIGSTAPGSTLTVNGSLSKSSGTFDIQHPLYPNTTKRLVHSFIEGPRCDLIYRGTVQLVNGTAIIDINKQCTFSPDGAMDDGTFQALCANPDIFLQNRTGFNRVIGSISGAILTITCETNSTDTISWMVVAERADPYIKEWNRTDVNGFLITQYSGPTGTNSTIGATGTSGATGSTGTSGATGSTGTSEAIGPTGTHV